MKLLTILTIIVSSSLVSYSQKTNDTCYMLVANHKTKKSTYVIKEGESSIIKLKNGEIHITNSINKIKPKSILIGNRSHNNYKNITVQIDSIKSILANYKFGVSLMIKPKFYRFQVEKCNTYLAPQKHPLIDSCYMLICQSKIFINKKWAFSAGDYSSITMESGKSYPVHFILKINPKYILVINQRTRQKIKLDFKNINKMIYDGIPRKTIRSTFYKFKAIRCDSVGKMHGTTPVDR